MKKLLLAALIGASAAMSASATDIYLIGANVDGVNWALGTNKMTDNGDGTYTWTGSKLGSGFKFNDGSWNDICNIGSNGQPITIGQPYIAVNDGGSGNIAFSDDTMVVNSPKVTLNLNSYEVVVTGEVSQTEKSFTLAGTFNNWNGNDANYALTESNGNYKGTFNLPAEPQFQVVLNGGTWYGFKDPVESVINLTETTPTVTVETSTGNENNFLLEGFSGGNVTFIFNYAGMHLTVSLDENAEAPTGPDLYLVGDNVNGQSWATMTNKMTNKGGGIYSWTGSVLGSGFKINDGTWDNPDYNIGAGEGEMTVGQPFKVISSGDSHDIVFANNIGRVENPTVVLDYSNMTVTVTGTPVEEIPESGFFIIGEVGGMSWDPTRGYPMSQISEGVYQANGVEITGSYFAFTSQLGNWSTVNAHRYGPEVKDATFIIGEPNTMVYGQDVSWNIAMGIYDFTVDTKNMTASAVVSSPENDGVEMIGSELNGSEVIYNLQGARVNRDNAVPGIYIVNGKKVVLK